MGQWLPHGIKSKEDNAMAENKKGDLAAATNDDGMVEIELMKDNDKYKDDVTVIVNGKAYQIKRGEKVKVPKAVAEVLDNAKAQRKFASRTIDRLREKSQN